MEQKSRPAVATLIRFRNLVDALNRVLADAGISELPPAVRGDPDERTIRFYVAEGLLSAPVRFDGRRALYGRRHLFELLAIKRLQSKGRSIHEIQDQLRHASIHELRSLAAVDSEMVIKAMKAAADNTALDRPRFFPYTAADPQSGPPPMIARTVSRLGEGPGSKDDPGRKGSPRTHRLARGVYLTIDPAENRMSTSDLRAALARFAETLSKEGDSDGRG